MKYSARTKARENYYNKAGQKVDGVTTILGLHDKPALLYWAWDLGMKKIDFKTSRNELAEVGKLLHHMVRATLIGETYAHLFKDYHAWEVKRAKESFKSFERWRSEHKIKVIKTEYIVISENLQAGGRFDLLSETDGLLTLTDWKTGKRCYKEAKMQVAAYAAMLEEQDGIKVDRVTVVNLPRGKGEIFDEVSIQDRETLQLYLDVFLGLNISHKAEKKLGIRWE